MYKKRELLQDVFCDGYSSGGGNPTERLKELSKEIYNDLLQPYINMDKEKTTIEMYSRTGYNHYCHDKNVILNHKLKSGEMKKEYPKLIFSAIRKNDWDIYNGSSYQTIGQIFTYEITGFKEDIADYYLYELHLSNETFYETYPTYESKATKQTKKTFNIKCSPEKADFFRVYISDLKTSYQTLTAEINTKKSRTEKSWKVKWFNKSCLFNLTVKGEQIEIDAIKRFFEITKSF
jgi:hypothetical protein